MELQQTLLLTKSLISAAVLLQLLEIYFIRSSWFDTGIWKWQTLEKDYPKKFRKFFNYFLSQYGFQTLILATIIYACFRITSSHFLSVIVLLFTTTMISLRWRGSFNGGVDNMTTIILASLTLTLFSDSTKFAEFAIFYISINLTFSYFISGIYKIKNPQWRNGSLLRIMLQESNYLVPEKVKDLANNKFLLKFLSWITILFEVSFPLVFVIPILVIPYLILGFLFHLANFFTLGLNRFVWVWLAAYPALYYVATKYLL